MYVYKGAWWSKRIFNYSLSATRQLTVLRSPAFTNATSIKSYLDEKQFMYREGHTSFMIDCPICDKSMKEKNGVSSYSVHVNKTTGSVVCQPCKMSGMCVPQDRLTCVYYLCTHLNVYIAAHGYISYVSQS